MFETTGNSVRIGLELPFALAQALSSLFVLGLGIFVCAWVVAKWHDRQHLFDEFKKWLAGPSVWHERPAVNWITWLAILLIPFWLALIGLTMNGALALWFDPPVISTDPRDAATSALAYRFHYVALVGLMTALAGLVAAPLALLRVYTVERQTKAQEEGLVTDRINKAVEGLGAERKVEAIGRSVKIVRGGSAPNALRRLGEQFISRTEIQWEGQDLSLAEGETMEDVGEWKVFSRTVPNLEVRIGAIYALERIAQDSLRDHIQIMEILCAYIRQNAPASAVKDRLPEPPEWFEGERDGRAWKRNQRNSIGELETGLFDDWLDLLGHQLGDVKPKADVQTALTVIGRRGRKQKEIEWGEWRPFEEMVPEWPKWETTDDGNPTVRYVAEVDLHLAERKKWRQLRPRFRLDLRGTDLRRATMSGVAHEADFSLALFANALLQGTILHMAKAQGANFYEAKAHAALLHEAQLQGATFFDALLQGADFRRANVQGTEMPHSQAQGATFRSADAQGANFSDALVFSADFFSVQAQGTSFSGAWAIRANFNRAQLQGADFASANVQDANFAMAQAQGTDFSTIQAQGVTFIGANIQSAAVKGTDLIAMRISPKALYQTFGDTSSRLGGVGQIPAHWPKWNMPFLDLNGPGFLNEWQKWQADKANYVPPPPPEPVGG